MKQVVTVLMLCVAFVFAACEDAPQLQLAPGQTGGAAYRVNDTGWESIPYDTEAHLTIMVWNANLGLIEDIGRTEQPAEMMHASHSSHQFVAIARAFNEIFPNIQIDMQGNGPLPNRDGIPWFQARQDFEKDMTT